MLKKIVTTASIFSLLALVFLFVSAQVRIGFPVKLPLPTTPTLLSPTNGNPSVSVPVSLSWSSSTNNAKYKVQVSTSPSFSPLVINQIVRYDTVLSVGLSNSTQYWWRVKGVNARDSSAYSTVFSFTTGGGAVPSVPVLAGPTDGGTGYSITPSLTWNASTGANTYRAQVSLNTSFTNIVSDESGIVDPIALIPASGYSNLSYSQTYYWRVYATNGTGNSAWSTTRSFTTMASTTAFFNIVEYEQWAEQPLGGGGYAIEPWNVDWTGVDVIFHFDNDPINSLVPPYFGYVSPSDTPQVANNPPYRSYADSVHFVHGVGITGSTLALDTAMHTSRGGSLVLQINAVTPDKLITLVTDSTKTDAFATAVAKFCERRNYDGVDINWENNTNGVSTAQAIQFFRIFRRRIDQYITTPQGKGAVGKRPWFSVTSPPGHFATYTTAIDKYMTFYIVQQGVVQWQASNGVWFDWAVNRGPAPTASACGGTGTWAVAMADWWNVPAGHNNLGMNYLPYLGFNKAKIAPASTIGGATVFRGANTIYECYASYGVDVFRGGNRSDGGNNEADFLAKGGTRVDDATYGASYISGTATSSTWADYKIALTSGTKFIWMSNDSTSMYWKTQWLVNNGWGGICPYSVTEDNVYTAPKSSRLKSHRGIVAALGRIITTPAAPILATPADAATGVSITPTFTWNASTGATTYRLQVSTSNTFGTTVINDSTITSTSYTSGTTLSNLTTYYWRVNAKNSAGTSAYSSTRSFQTITASAHAITNVVTYWPTWAAKSWAPGQGIPPESLHTSLTHIVHFDNSNIVKTPPYYSYMVDSTSNALAGRQELLYAANSNPGSWPSNPTPWQNRLITWAHARGMKVLLTMVAIDSTADTTLIIISGDSAKTELLTQAACSFAKRFGYDGLELDWEMWAGGSPPAASLNRFTRILRRNMDVAWGGTNTAPLMASAGRFQSSLYWPSQDAYFTAYILQLYDYGDVYGGASKGGNVIWYNSPLKKDYVYPGAECEAWYTSGMISWINAGHSRTKMGGLMPSYTIVYRGDSTLFNRFTTRVTNISYVKTQEIPSHGGLTMRDVARGNLPYYAGRGTAGDTLKNTNGWEIVVAGGELFRASFEDSISVYAKMVYADSLGVSTMGYYDVYNAVVYNGTTKDKQFPINGWIKSFLGVAPTLSSPTDGDTTQNTFLTLTWNAVSGAVSYRVQISTSSTFSTILEDQAGIATTSYSPQLVHPVTPYYWRVNVTTASGISSWSTSRMFKTRPIVASYFPTWCYGATGDEYKMGVGNEGNPRLGIPWNRMDIVIHFASGVDPATPPYFKAVTSAAESLVLQYNGSQQWLGNWQDTLIQAAHAAGKKVVICNGVLGSGALLGSDSAKVEILTKSIAAYVQRKHYDGSDVDWEYPDSPENHARYLRMMRRAYDNLNDGKHYLVLTSSVNANLVYSVSNCPLYADNYVDYYVAQMYQPSVNNSSHGYNDFIHMSPQVWNRPGACSGEDGPYDWTNWQVGALAVQGHAKNKLVGSVPSYGVYMTNSNAFCSQAPDNIASGPRWRDVEGFRNHGATYNWDDISKESWLSGPVTSNYSASQINVSAGNNLIVAYCDTTTMKARANYTLTQGYAGIFTYDLSTGQAVAHQNASDSNNPFESIAWKIFHNVVPSVPTLTSPANGATSVTTPTTTFSWNASSRATNYRIQISINSGFSSSVIDSSKLTTTTYSAANLLPNTTYYWRVDSYNGSGTSGWSDARSFTTASGPKLITYYVIDLQRQISNGSFFTGFPAWEWEMNGVTHIIASLNRPNIQTTAPYWTQMSGDDSLDAEFGSVKSGQSGTHYLDSLIAIAHRQGIKVLTCLVQFSDQTELLTISTDSVKVDQLAYNVVQYCKRKGFDGVEFDVEGGYGYVGANYPTPTDMSRILRRFRVWLNTMSPPGLLGNAAGNGDHEYYQPIADTYVDWYDPQFYGGSWWDGSISHNAAWPLAAIYKDNYDTDEQASLAQGKGANGCCSAASWVARGVPKSKLVVGISECALMHLNVNTIHSPTGTDKILDYWNGAYGWKNSHDALDLLSRGGTQIWDNTMKGGYITGTATSTFTMDDGGSTVSSGTKFLCLNLSAQAVDSIGVWAKNQGYGGIMMYDVAHDIPYRTITSTVKNLRTPLITRMARALGIKQ